MNYLHPDLIEKLAAEYVLGTLRGKARMRFEKLMAAHPVLHKSVVAWEERLVPLSLALPAAHPKEKVWLAIEHRIHSNAARTSSAATGFWSNLALWRAWGGLSTATALVLAVVLTTTPPSSPLLVAQNPGLPIQQVSTATNSQTHGEIMPAAVAVFHTKDMKPVWSVKCDMATGKIIILVKNDAMIDPSAHYELWALTKGGTKPMPLGKLPMQDGMEMPLPEFMANWQQAKDGVKMLAVTMEQPGGPREGKPSDQVLYQAPLVEF